MPLPRFALAAPVGLALVACGGGGSGTSTDGTAHHPFPGDPSCDYQRTDYPGDCRAPPVIDPSVGYVAHYGPADYDDPAQIDAFVIQPGDEKVDCAYSKLGNTTDLYYDEYDVYSRPGMHHVILFAAAADIPDGTRDACQLRDGGGSLLAVVQGAIDGNVYHYPPDGTIAPENVGLGTRLAPHQTIAYELHAVNATDQPLLKENWTVFRSKPADEVTETVGQIAFNGGLDMDILPHTQQVVTNTCTVPQGLGDVRILDFFGHMHSHGQRFSAWAITVGTDGIETRTLVYESYDWSKLDLIQFNTITHNTPVTYAGGVPGGASGILHMKPGDRIEYGCQFDNTEDYDLRFAAKAFRGEMCNMFGSYAPGTTNYWACLGK